MIEHVKYLILDPIVFIRGCPNVSDTCLTNEKLLVVDVFYLTADGPPPDGTPNVITQSFKKALVILFYFFAMIGIIFSIACLVFNTVFRNRRYI